MKPTSHRGRVLTYPAARWLTVLFTALVFCAIAAFIGYFLAHAMAGPGPLQLPQARLLSALALVTTGFFAGHAGALGLLDAFSQGRFHLPTEGLPPPSTARAQNPWRAAVVGAAAYGLPSAALAFGGVAWLWPRGVEVKLFVSVLGMAAALLAGLQVAVATGSRLLREATLPVPARAFQGSPSAYLWLRHLLPQASVNGILNGLAAAAQVPGPFFATDAAAPRTAVLQDVFVNGFFLMFAMANGASMHARFDVRWGTIPSLPSSPPRAWLRWATLLGVWLVSVAAVYGLFALSGRDQVAAWPFAVARGLGFGLYCGAVAYIAASWSIRRSDD